MGGRMADTNEQNRDDDNHKLSEDDHFVQKDSKDKNRYNAKKCIRRLKWIVSVCMFLMMVAVVWALVVYPLIPSNCSKSSGSRDLSSKVSNKTKARTCVFTTDREYWKSIPDNLDEYCKPRKIIGGISGYLATWIQCPGTQLYIPLSCACHFYVICPVINNRMASQTKHYMKRTCTECTSQDHCSCQNFGKCYNCTEKMIKHSKCLCQPGTNGTYCTKISKRLCTKSEESNELENCKNSNNLECFLRLDNHDTYICKWKEAMKGDYPSCGVSVSATSMIKGGMSSLEGMQNSETPQLTTSNILLWVIFLLLVVAVIGLAILQCYGRCKIYTKKCCEKWHSLMQI
ncbi:uncharacterized protein LOC143045504 [Mytilus galloprovincialis]|uniref:uncharacterized protein LOC143045504 n=1 Tax=Mytilus galloprovincialis TaxID=29158 RepID=UPI003F7C007F